MHSDCKTTRSTATADLELQNGEASIPSTENCESNLILGPVQKRTDYNGDAFIRLLFREGFNLAAADKHEEGRGVAVDGSCMDSAPKASKGLKFGRVALKAKYQINILPNLYLKHTISTWLQS